MPHRTELFGGIRSTAVRHSGNCSASINWSCSGTVSPSFGERGRNRTKHSPASIDRKSTRLNSSHLGISYAVFCLKKNNIQSIYDRLPPDGRLRIALLGANHCL